MAGNLFIGDTFFKENPTKILGVQTIKKGRFDSDMIMVKGSMDDVLAIEATPIKPVDIYPVTELSPISKTDMIQRVMEAEISEIKTARVKKIRGQSPAAKITNQQGQEVYSYREIDLMYNKEISQDEKEAYYLTHPELNHKLLFDNYTNTREQLIEKGLICLDQERYFYSFSYTSGNISRKISTLKRDAASIIQKFGQAQYDRQLQMLEAVRPAQKGFEGSESIIILPHSNFAKDQKISELRFGKPELNGETSLFQAFKGWLRQLPPDSFEKSNYYEITHYYLDNENIPISKVSRAQQDKDEKNAINIRQRTKEEGDSLFARFLKEELLPENQARIAYLWNEKYNSVAEPILTKFPVCFRLSKTFKGGAPLQLTITQRQAVAFEMEKLSGLFAYGVGVGKTLAAIACCSQAIDNNLAKKPVFVVPTNTYEKWLSEIQGSTNKDTGVFNHGALPHLPQIQGLYNLNPSIVQNIKIYSDKEQLQFDALQKAIDLLRDKKEVNPHLEDAISALYKVSWVGLKQSYQTEYLESTNSANPKTFSQYVIAYLKAEYNYLIYTLGELKQFPDGTIFVITEVGLQRLGLSDANKGKLTETFYKILSQGELTAEQSDKRDAAALEIKIEQTISSSHKNAQLQIEDFGFDWACFDESHLYKKLFTYVKGQATGISENFSGEKKVNREKSKYELKSGATPSARALSAFVLSHYIQKTNNNRNVINLTATPFTNSPLEVYSMLVLTSFHSLQELGVDNMIDFFDTFMKINYGIKYTPQKTVVKDVQLTGYNNLPQLRQIIYSVMDKKDDPNLKRPVLITYPSIEEGRETTLPMTALQDELVAQVKDYISGKGGDFAQICQEAVNEEIDNMDFDGLDDDTLIAEWERLTQKEFEGEREDLPDSKRDKMIAQIKNIKNSGTEFDESDLDEREKLGVRILRGLTMLRQITLSPYLYYKACRKAGKMEGELPNFREYVETSPKLMYCLGATHSSIEFERKSGLKIGGTIIYMNVGTEYFPLIKEYLVKVYHLSENQVGMVTGKMSRGAKENVKRRFLSGDILVIIGSSTISVGVDLQDNANSLWNLYYDYNPTDAQQIVGRGWRQGNRYYYFRVNYPQCYGSADPVIFQYLYEKTLRINEIWDRTSGRQELDLRDFDPKALQKKLITNPEELADWDLLEENDKIQSGIIFLENRKESLSNAIYSAKQVIELRPKVISWLNQLVNRKRELAKKTALDSQGKKLQELAVKYATDPVKYQEKYNDYMSDRYDYGTDPDNKYSPVDYENLGDEALYTDALKWITTIDDWNYNDQDSYGSLYYKSDTIREDLRSFRSNYRDMHVTEERVLKPMGLTFETATDPVEQLNQKISDLHEQLEKIVESREQKVEFYRKQQLENRKNIRTVKDRIEEWARDNDKYLPAQQLLPGKPVELPSASPEELLSLNGPEEQTIDMPVPLEQIKAIEPVPEITPKPKRQTIVFAGAKGDGRTDNRVVNIEKQIKALHLAHGFADKVTAERITKQINALSLALKYA